MDFCQTAFTDTDTPAPFADSLPITFNIIADTITEGLEYFQARIVDTSDRIRVRIGQQDTVNVAINDDNSESSVFYFTYVSVFAINTSALVACTYLSNLLQDLLIVV